MPINQMVNRQSNTFCVVRRRWPPNGSAISRNRSIDMNVNISSDTSDETIANTPTPMHVHDAVHSNATLPYCWRKRKSWMPMMDKYSPISMSDTAKFRITMLTARFSSRCVNRPHNTKLLPRHVIVAMLQAEYRSVGFDSKSSMVDRPAWNRKINI